MSDEASANQLTNEDSQIRSDSAHPIFYVFIEFFPIFADLNDLSAKCLYVLDIRIAYVGAHRGLRGLFHNITRCLLQDVSEINVVNILAETLHSRIRWNSMKEFESKIFRRGSCKSSLSSENQAVIPIWIIIPSTNKMNGDKDGGPIWRTKRA
jgi:hypothetical protein